MSTSVEQRIVEMKFDNAGFAKGVEQTLGDLDRLDKAATFEGGRKGLKNLQTAADSVSFKNIESGIMSISESLDHMQSFGFQVFENLSNRAVNWATNMVKSLSVDQIGGGFNEYELKMDSIRTIMSSSKADLPTVNKYLQDLNEYSDKTIYSFSDMTASIGKFTNAGVDLDKAVTAIQGISNEAALSGANAQQASAAMYNFAQALSSGSVKLIDWKSIENANMATVEFKEELIKTALELGTVQEAEGGYISTTGDANGKVSDLFTSTTGFNEALSAQWLTTDVLVETLGRYADETTDIGARAFNAAQEVTTFSKMMDALKESVGSGWASTFEILFGNLEEAKVLWTNVNNVIGGIIAGISDTRNGILEIWKANKGHEAMFEGLKNIFYVIRDITSYIGLALETLFGHRYLQNFEDVANFFSDRESFSGNLVTIKRVSDFLTSISYKFRDLTTKLRSIFNPEVEKSRHFLEEIYQCTQAILIPMRFIFRIVSGIAGKILPPLFKIAAVGLRTIIYLVSRIGYALTEGGLQMKLYALADFIVNGVGGSLEWLGDIAKKIGKQLSRFLTFEGLGSSMGFMGTLGRGLVSAFEWVISAVEKAYAAIKKFAGEIANALGFVDVNEALSTLADTIAKKFVKAVSYTSRIIKSLTRQAHKFYQTVKPIVNFLKNKFLKTLEEFSKFWKENPKLKKFRENVDGLFESFRTAAASSKGLDTAQARLEELVSKGYSLEEARKKLGDFTAEFKNWGDVVDYVKDKFQNLIKSIKDSKSFQNLLAIFNSLKEKITKNKLITDIITKFNELKTKVTESGIFTKIQDYFTGISEKVQEFIGNTGLGDFIDRAKDAFHGFAEDLKSLDLTSITGAVQGISDAVGGLIDKLNGIRVDILEKVTEKIQEIYHALFPEQAFDENAEAGSLFEKVKTVVTGGLLGLVEGIRGFNWTYALQYLKAGLSVYFLTTLYKVLKDFKKSGNVFGIIISNMQKLLSNLANSVKAVKYQILAEALFRAAEAIALIAAALTVLSFIPEEKLQAALGAIGAVLLLLTILVAVKGLVDKLTDKTKDTSKAAEELTETGNKLIETLAEFGKNLISTLNVFLKRLSTAALIGVLAGAVTALVGVVLKLADIPPESIGKGLFTIGLIIATIVAFLIAVNKYVMVAGGEKQFAKLASLIGAIAFAINRLTAACIKLADMKNFEDGFTRIIWLLVALGGAIVALGMLSTKLMSGADLTQLAILIAALAVAIMVLVPAIFALSIIPTETLFGVILGLAGLVGVLGLFIAIMGSLNGLSVAIKNVAIAIGAMVGMSVALVLFTAAIMAIVLAAPLIEKNWKVIANVLGAFIVTFIIVIGIAYAGSAAIAILGSALLKIGGAVALFGLGIFLCAAACATFANALDAMITNVAGREDEASQAISLVMYAVLKGLIDAIGYFIAACIAGMDDTCIALRDHLPSLIENLTALVIEGVFAVIGGIVDAIVDGIGWIGKVIDRWTHNTEATDAVDNMSDDIKNEADKKLTPAANGASESTIDALNTPFRTQTPETGGYLDQIESMINGSVPGLTQASTAAGEASVSGFDQRDKMAEMYAGMQNQMGAWTSGSQQLLNDNQLNYGTFYGGWGSTAEAEGGAATAATNQMISEQEAAMYGLDAAGAGQAGDVNYSEALEMYSGKPVASTEEMTDEVLDTMLDADTKGAGETEVEGLSTGIEDNGYLAENAAKSVATDAGNAAGSMSPIWEANSYNLDSGMAKGILNNADIVYDAVRQVMNNSLAAGNEVAEINSPSKKTEEQGYFLDAGWAKGITKNSGMMFDAVTNVTGGTLDTLSEAMRGIPALLEEDWDYNPVITPVLDSTSVLRGMGNLNDILTGGTSATVGFTTTNRVDVGDAVNQLSNLTGRNNKDIMASLDRNTAMTSRLIDILRTQKIRLDGKTCVGGMVDEIDKQLGQKQILAGRRGRG